MDPRIEKAMRHLTEEGGLGEALENAETFLDLGVLKVHVDPDHLVALCRLAMKGFSSARLLSLSDLRIANIRRDQEWNTGSEKLSLTFRGNELAGEVGEACNVVKKMERARLGLKGSHATAEQLGEELADVLICLDLLAMDAGVDLSTAVRAKFNATSEKYGLATRIPVP
jgi:NTP pyrophosphatase (non-canonical NTP hydrolase)